MPRLLALVMVLAACGGPDPAAEPPEVAEATAAPADASVPTTAEALTTTTTAPTATTEATTAVEAAPSPTIVPREFPVCEALPTQWDIVEGRMALDGTVAHLDGSPLAMFDLAELAGVETYRFRTELLVPAEGQYRDGFTHVRMTEELDWEWLLGPSGGFWVQDEAGTWVAGERDTTFAMLQMYTDPALVYVWSLDALDDMTLEHWEMVEDRPVAVFAGGADVYAALLTRGEVKPGNEGASVRIWMSPDCHPMRVHMLNDGEVDGEWELYDLDRPVDFVIPAIAPG